MRHDADSTVQLGYGACQKRIELTVSSQNSAIAIDLAADKAETKRQLANAMVPLPAGNVAQ